MADSALNISLYNSSNNISLPFEIPRDLQFNDDSLVSIIAYGVLFVIAACGNVTVFITLFRNRHRKSRVNLFIMHLSIADMIVTFIMIPLEIGWHVTVSWKAGDVGCRIFMFLRTLGFYLSSFVLVAISVDRYFAITHPLSIGNADRRGRLLLITSWLFSIVASVPQSVIFHVEVHPYFPWFEQCVTFNFFPSPAHELAYNLFNMAALYWFPLLVIIISYSLIMWEITKRSRESREQSKSQNDCKLRRHDTLRRSGIGRIEKARIRTLKLTIVIVLVFVMCWTPYFVINAWFWIDRESAMKIDAKVTRGLLIFAVSNSCVNPIVYGMFTHTFVKEWKKGCCYMFHLKRNLSFSTNTSKLRNLVEMKPVEQDMKDNAPSSVHHVSYEPPNQDGPWSERQCSHLQDASSHRSSTEYPITQQVTPPHIAHGMGQKTNFENYLLI